MKRIALLIILLVLFNAACAAPSTSVPTQPPPTTQPTITPGQATPPCSVILIGWDGAQRDHVKQALARGELPSLQKLGSEGALVDIDIIHTTDTKAGWAQILTGYNPEVTGVYSNGRYQPIPSGYTVFERLEAVFGPEQFVTVAVIGKKGNVDAEGPALKQLKPGQKPSRALKSSLKMANDTPRFRASPITTRKTAWTFSSTAWWRMRSLEPKH